MLTPACSSNAIRPNSASPAPPGIGESAMTTRTSENATSASENVSPDTSKTTDAVHMQQNPAAKVPKDATKITPHRRRNSSVSPVRISSKNSTGCARSMIARVLTKRGETLRVSRSRAHEANLPSSANRNGDRSAAHQKTPEKTMINTPAITANTSVDVAVPTKTGTARTATGKPHVEKDGTTAVATIDVAMVE